MNTLNINTIANAFTKTAKNESGEVLREAISKFNFAINLDYDLDSPKMKQIVRNLIIETIKVSIQAVDRAELWDKEVIAEKFAEHANAFTEDKLYEIVTSGAFGLKAFETWVKDLLIPAIEKGSGKVLTVQQKRTIIHVTKAGKRMNEQSMNKVLQWIDTYGTDLENVDKVIHYLTNVQDTTVEDLDALDALGI